MLEVGCVGFPVSPIFFSCPGIASHDAIVNGFPRRHDVTRENNLLFKWYSDHEFDCNGNVFEKTVRKESLVLVYCAFSKDLLAWSAMILRTPAMDTVRHGDERWVCCLRARTLRRCPATTDFEDWSLLLHETAGVLSQKIPTVENCSDFGAICSKTSHARSTPAISRSELVIVPFGFEKETMLFVMSAGHCIRHTYGLIMFVPLIHTPPTPDPAAST